MAAAPEVLPPRSTPSSAARSRGGRLRARLATSPPLQALAVFLGYLAVSLLLFGVPFLLHPYSTLLGGPRSDAKFFVWAFSWWPHAIAHGLNPIWTRAVWAPRGYNLAWATGAPGPSLLSTPITLLGGPVLSVAVVAVLACPLSALGAYLLCRRVTHALWPSVIGGYVFGFSTYAIGHVGSQVNLETVFAVPLCVYLVVLRLERALGARAFVALLALLLTLQFLTSTEVFATMILFGGVALAAGAVVAPRLRGTLLRTAGLIGLSCAITAVVVSPYLYYVFAYGVPRRDLTGTDLLSFVVPRTRTLIGGRGFSGFTSSRFPGAAYENTAYLGPPLIAVLVHFFLTQWRRPVTKVLLVVAIAAVVGTLGATFTVAGHALFTMPWRAVEHLPLLSNVAPRRFTLYIFLVSAVAVALWLAAKPGSRPRYLVALSIPVFLFPAFSPNYAHEQLRIPSFFADGTYRTYLAPGANVLMLPDQPLSMAIQARTGFTFRLVMGYTGPQSNEFRLSPLLQTLYRGEVTSDAAAFRQFLRGHRVSAIVVDEPGTVEGALSAVLGQRPLEVGGVTLYPLRPPP